MSLVSVSYERTQTRARRNFHLSNELSPTPHFARRTHAFSTTRNASAQNDLPDPARHDDRA